MGYSSFSMSFTNIYNLNRACHAVFFYHSHHDRNEVDRYVTSNPIREHGRVHTGACIHSTKQY